MQSCEKITINNMKLLSLCLLIPGLLAYKHFQEKVPNGSRIPHPCKANFVWHGLGHMDKDGGGMRNKFGDDFDRNGQKWDRCLCEADSDGDGKTNGEELGDPDCEWLPGDSPAVTALSQLSHPGVCEPMDSAECKVTNNFDVCKDKEPFKCDAFDHEGVETFTLKIPETPVPAEETTYICMLMDIPTDGDWHLIGNMPEIDNVNVMHHVVISLCTAEAVALLNGTFDSPSQCIMSSDFCTGYIPGWTVGMDGQCLPEVYGVPLGAKTGYVKAMVEYHWNNPELKEGYTDGSGLKFFYEPKRRPEDLARALVGTFILNIPPKQLYHEQSTVCTPACTESKLNGTVRYITGLLPHMHYLGRGFVVEHHRGEERLPDLLNLDSYAYDNPIEELFDPPVEFYPGDKIVVRCIFNSMSQDKKVFFGQGTADEMCMAFLSYYPPPGFDCFGAGDRAFCDFDRSVGNTISEVIDCDFQAYFANDFPSQYFSLQAVCDEDGLSCDPSCKEAIDRVYTHECMQGDDQYFITMYASRQPQFGNKFLHLLHSCDEYEVHVPEVDEDRKEGGELCATAGATLAVVSLMTIFLALAATKMNI